MAGGTGGDRGSRDDGGDDAVVVVGSGDGDSEW